jgi:Do/DeqQ family serine protease
MRRTWLIFSQAVTVAVAVLFVVATLKPQWLKQGNDSVLPGIVSIIQAPELPASPAPAASAAEVAPVASYRSAARRATPAVVSITARKTPGRDPRASDPWFQFFFGDRLRQQPQIGLGSGVIVSPEGYLLTNNHVIEGADDIDVLLADGREARASVVGTDPESDLAVLKIDLDRLPVLRFGNSDAVEVGDTVLAIGNPFGVGQTVTAGIVSALGRSQLGINTFENFIQTDAAINPGNSGGALVDVEGNLLGINTAIFSRTGGSLGIGFAIPANVARDVLQSLIKTGQVVRGWIGVEPVDLTPEIAQTLRLPVKEGVLIRGVLQSGPAASGGIQPGDVVTRIAERPVSNSKELVNAVAALTPKTPAVIRVQRGDKALDVTVTVAQRPKMRVERVQQ